MPELPIQANGRSARANRPFARANRRVAHANRQVAHANRPVANENRPVANENKPVANENRRCARATWRLGMLLTYSVSTLSAAQVLAQPSFRGTDHARSVAGPCRPVLRRSPF